MKEFPEALARVKIDPYSRTQSFRLHDMFPTPDDGTCSCGCGKKLTGRRTRWASDECSDAAVSFYYVVCGRSATVRYHLEKRDGGLCGECGRTEYGRERERRPDEGWLEYLEAVPNLGWEADHIVPVHQGGGGCTLDGYQTLCDDCHRAKTARNARLRAAERTRDDRQLDALDGSEAA